MGLHLWEAARLELLVIYPAEVLVYLLLGSVVAAVVGVVAVVWLTALVLVFCNNQGMQHDCFLWSIFPLSVKLNLFELFLLHVS